MIAKFLNQNSKRRMDLFLQSLHTLNPNGTIPRRINIPGEKDQVSELADSFNSLLDHLEKANGNLKDLDQDYQRLFNLGISGNVWANPAGEILRCNQAFAELLGYEAIKEVIGQNIRSLLFHSDDWEPLARELQAKKKIDQTEWGIFDRNRSPVVVHGRLISKLDDQGRITQIVGTFADLSRLKKLEEELDKHHRHDPLTGLLNRLAFEKEISFYDSGEYDPVGILIVDVNGLKFVNENNGYEEANHLLRVTARILQQAFPGNEKIARVGSDEFAVLAAPADRRVFETARQSIRQAVEGYNTDQPGIPLSLAVGFALNDEAPCTIQEVFTQADNTMHREKLLCSQSIHSSVVQTLNKALEVRDFITGGHARRLSDLVEKLAKSIGLSERSVIDLRLLAQFHDIGKVGIPDRLLMKPGPLTPEEAIEMQKHCEIGYRIALSATDLVPIADWILKHHEWWNGHGYPGGLKGETIPMECRILALSDAYDVMTNDRPYRKAAPHQEAMEEIKRYAGIQFDPFLAKKFCELFMETPPE